VISASEIVLRACHTVSVNGPMWQHREMGAGDLTVRVICGESRTISASEIAMRA
jgi:hypothetical protein